MPHQHNKKLSRLIKDSILVSPIGKQARFSYKLLRFSFYILPRRLAKKISQGIYSFLRTLDEAAGRQLLNVYHNMKAKTYYLMPVTQALAENHQGFRLLSSYKPESTQLSAVQYYDALSVRHILPPEKVSFPDYYSALIKNAIIYAPSSFVIRNKTLYYDYVTNIREQDAFTKHYYSPETLDDFTQKKAKLYFSKPISTAIKCGISLFEDYQFNYYHWLLEVVPKLLLLETNPLFEAYPLLVPANLPAQFYEVLQCVNQDKREVILLPERKRQKVKRLLYLSALSITNEVKTRASGSSDYCISPVAINFLREKCLPKSVAERGNRLIYLARSHSVYRRMLNDSEMQALVKSFGFEVIECMNLSFKEQVKTFSEAKVILGSGGASFANLTFCSPGSKGVLFTPGSIQDNFYIFHSIASSVGMKLMFVQGRPINDTPIHPDHYVDITLIEKLLEDFLKA